MQIALTQEEQASARRMIGLVVWFGPVGLACSKHLFESFLLFSFGRLLIVGLERVGLTAGQLTHIHKFSDWFEISVYTSFCILCAMEVLWKETAHFRGMSREE